MELLCLLSPSVSFVSDLSKDLKITRTKIPILIQTLSSLGLDVHHNHSNNTVVLPRQHFQQMHELADAFEDERRSLKTPFAIEGWIANFLRAKSPQLKGAVQYA